MEISSCQINESITKSNKDSIENIGEIKLDFEILTDEISLDEINKIDKFKKKLIAYSNFEIVATLKQINKTSENIEIDNFIVYENFEIIDVQKQSKDDLINVYHYTPIFNPETYEINGIKMLKPDEFSIDSLNLVNDFRFYVSNPDTLLIRIKKQYFEKEIYSNWDTLIIKIKTTDNTGYSSMPARLPTANSLQAKALANLLAHRIAFRYLQP